MSTDDATDCPRCEGDLIAYVLDGDHSVVCSACGYVDIPADHHPAPDDGETWEEALQRFRERHRETEGVHTELEIDGTVYRLSPNAANRFRDLTEKQRAIVTELLAEPDPMEPDRTRTAIGEAASAHRSYVSDVVKEYGDVIAALAAGRQ